MPGQKRNEALSGSNKGTDSERACRGKQPKEPTAKILASLLVGALLVRAQQKGKYAPGYTTPKGAATAASRDAGADHQAVENGK